MLEVNERIQFGKTLKVKGTVQREFRPPFFHHSNLPVPLTQSVAHAGSRQAGLNYFRFWVRFRRVMRIFLNHPGVSYCGESCDFSESYLKGHSSKIIDLFFSSCEPAWATDQWVKICLLFNKILPSYSNFFGKISRGIILP